MLQYFPLMPMYLVKYCSSKGFASIASRSSTERFVFLNQCTHWRIYVPIGKQHKVHCLQQAFCQDSTYPCNITVTTPLDGIRVIIRNCLLLLARIETEYSLLSVCKASSPSDIASSCGVGSYFVLGLAPRYSDNSNHWWVVWFPEWIRCWKRHTVERGVFWTNLIIMLCSILEIIMITILHELSHFAAISADAWTKLYSARR